MGLKINDLGKIIFRHPHVMKDKYGKVICVAVAKLSGERQGKVKDCLESLFESKPLTRGEFKGKPDKIALDAYFNPIGQAIEDDRDYDAEEKARPKQQTQTPKKNMTPEIAGRIVALGCRRKRTRARDKSRN